MITIVRIIYGIVACIITLGICQGSALAEEYIQVPAAIHVASRVSDGKFSIAQIVDAARQNSFGVVIITDRDLARWEYGLWPVRSLIKKVVQTQSIFSYGIARYLADVNTAQKANPDMVILGGLESAPFYYWRGIPLRKGFSVHKTNEHVLTIGLTEPEDFRRLPIIGNPRAWGASVSWDKIALFCVGIFGIVIGIVCMRQRYRNYAWLWQALGASLILLGITGMASAIPFVNQPFDAYHGDRGVVPYQHYIDYARAKDALVFWAHPESRFEDNLRGVSVYTEAYPDDLLATQGYTGYEVFYAGEQRVGDIGGVWDQVLLEYCNGARRAPVWAIAGSGFDSTGDLHSALAGVRTVLFVLRLNRREVIHALRAGKMYAACGAASAKFSLDMFAARDPSGTVSKTMGEELTISQNPLIEISGHFFDGQELPLTIQLIKNGVLVEVFEVKAPFHLFYEDAQTVPGPTLDYYRLTIQARDLNVITNPIFVKRSNLIEH